MLMPSLPGNIKSKITISGCKLCTCRGTFKPRDSTTTTKPLACKKSFTNPAKRSSSSTNNTTFIKKNSTDCAVDDGNVWHRQSLQIRNGQPLAGRFVLPVEIEHRFRFLALGYNCQREFVASNQGERMRRSDTNTASALAAHAS